ncbi:MAG: ribbon-helix-helix domain-containing protein [Acidobacteriia bacterium]|nr:ribbon-helix-helix domain-containing protein [Terriglobia bacterium]
MKGSFFFSGIGPHSLPYPAYLCDYPNIYLSDRQKERLRERAVREGVPVSELIRRAVDSFLAWDDPSYVPAPHTAQKERRSHPPHE